MQKLKEYKYIILLVLLILGFAFYWFEFRPSMIRKKCIEIAGNTVKGTNDMQEFEFSYKICLRLRGLEN